MSQTLQLHHPWFVAVWPGMGQVAINAGVYLLAKLGMTLFAELEASGLFDLDQVEVRGGIIQPSRRPRNRLFVWKDPEKRHDLVVFVGEAQPPIGKYTFCRQLISHAKELGVERVFTFAAMATKMRPEQRSRVFGAATDQAGLEEIKRLELQVLEDGQIGGLNGVLLSVAAEMGLRGSCLLGEIPHVLAELPFPKASLAILEVFTTITGFDLDLADLAEQARASEKPLGEIFARVERAYQQQFYGSTEEEEFIPELYREPDGVAPADRQRIEELFAEAARDRRKAFDLKRELDRLGLFKEYEDRFLDLFKKPQ